MSAPFLGLIAGARRAGLILARRGDELVIRGPRSQEPLVRALLVRKPDVLACLAVYRGDALHLDWRREPILDKSQPCALCRRSTLLIEPYDGRPAHKSCTEAKIRPGTVPAQAERDCAA